MFKELRMTHFKEITLSAITIALLSGCGDTTINQAPSNVTIIGDTITTGTVAGTGTQAVDSTIIADAASLPQKTLSGDITTDTVLTADTLWLLDGLVVLKSGATLTIEAGTTIAGLAGTGVNTSYMIIDKGAKIFAIGNTAKPIIFTSKTRVDTGVPEVGEWGGLTIIGHAGNGQVQPYEVNNAFASDATDLADSSGILRYVKILNSGITMDVDKEINGLSMVGVGSGTIVENITVDYSDDDCIELWGGTVNLSNIDLQHCTDDYFDIDDGYSGTVKNLVINTTLGNSGIEMSGNTYANFDGVTITTGSTQTKEGGIFFKKDGIGGHFKNVTIIHNGGQITPHGAIHSLQTADISNVTFENVAIVAPAGLRFTGDSAAALEAKFNSGPDNSSICTIPGSSILSGNLTGCNVLTNNQVWTLDGLVVIPTGSQIRLQEGTTVAGLPGTGVNTSYMIVDKGAKIYANGTESNPVTFTSADQTVQEVGLWGGLTIIGHAGNGQVNPYEVNNAFVADDTNLTDSSGILRNLKILNSGVTMDVDKEINGLSMVGVGSGTVVENIIVDYSDDDCVEIWGGTVNLTNVDLQHCTDDYFDIDDGYSGTVKNLVINTTLGNSGIEMSGNTYATFDGFSITTGSTQTKEGGIFFKKDGIGGHFKNGTIVHNGGLITPHGAIHSLGLTDISNVSFDNVTITAPATLSFTGDSAAALETAFTNGIGNTLIN